MRSKLLVFVLFVFSSFSGLNAQVVGEIFDADYANEEFGKVVSLIEINNDELKIMLETAGEYIMLNIETGTVRALDSERNNIMGTAVSDSEVYYKMSTSQIYLLIEKGLKNMTLIEMRPKTLTLTNGMFTLELVYPCPPFCN